MADLDETDLEILRLLLEDARRPFNEVASQVDVSGPTVSDRVDRMVERGIIKRFTVDLDRGRLVEGIGLLIELEVVPGTASNVLHDVTEIGGVEHAFRTADDRVIAHARLDPTQARDMIETTIDLETISAIDISLVEDARWSPTIRATGFAVACAECGNSVTEEGTTTTIDGDIYEFCCSSCEDRFVTRYDQFREAA